jgi:hypothetical protein
VKGDAVGAAQVGFDSGPDRVGCRCLSRLSNGGDMIDVYAQFCHRTIIDVDVDV